MRIEKLTPPARPGSPWTLVLETGEKLKVTEGVVADFALYQGEELDQPALEELKAAAFAGALREKTISLLTGRLMSAGQLKEKLLTKGATPRQAEELAAWAQDIGLLNDREYAAALVRHYQDRGYGVYKIKDELYRRKVPREYWEEALEALEEPGEQISRLLAARLKDPTDPKQVKKASDALVRRGFSWSQVSQGIEGFRRTWEDEQIGD